MRGKMRHALTTRPLVLNVEVGLGPPPFSLTQYREVLMLNMTNPRVCRVYLLALVLVLYLECVCPCTHSVSTQSVYGLTQTGEAFY